MLEELLCMLEELLCMLEELLSMLEELLCMLIWGFCFQSNIANFKLHPGEYEYGPAELAGSCCDSSVGAFDSMASELKVTIFIG